MPLALSRDPLPISVVIATLGGRELERTVERLCAGTRIPEEILICIPKGVVIEARLENNDCLQVLQTPCRGQVAQRAYGLSRTRSPYVLQMDDDISLSDNALERLFSTCAKAGTGSAVAPLFKDCSTGKFLTQYSQDLKGILQSIQASAVGGASWGAGRMGRIDRAGIPYAVDPNYCAVGEVVETEWLPGGCVICHREDLVADNYYPFPGKAYSEDVIHSILWRQRGVRLWVATAITCCTQVVAMPTSIEGVRADYRARAYVVSMNGGSLWRCRLWFALFICRRWLARLLRRNA